MSLQPNRRLEYERTRRGWSQQRLADALGGITRQTVNRWETGRTHPSPYYRGLLINLFGLDAAALGLEPGQVTALLPPGHDFLDDPATPLPSPDGLVGRNELLRALKARLLEGHHTLALSALDGLPGVGKTALVVELVYDEEVRKHFGDGVLWAGLGPTPDVQGLLARWATLLGVAQPERTMLSPPGGLAMAIREAIGPRHLLLVFDDAWSIEDALALQVGGPGCAYLLTTRNPPVAAAFALETTTVPTLDGEDGLRLLTRQAGLEWLQQGARGDQAAELADALHLLVRLVGGLPLALTLMGTWLRVQAHAGQVRRVRQAIEELSGDAGRRLQLAGRQAVLEQHPSLPPGAALSLGQVIRVSFDMLPEKARAALVALTVFPAKPNSFSEAAALAVASCATRTLDALLDAGLVETTGEDRYSLHQTIADYASTQRAPDDGVEERLVHYYAKLIENSVQTHTLPELEIANIFVALQEASQHMPAELVHMIIAYYPFLQMRGLYALAKERLERAEAYVRSFIGSNIGTNELPQPYRSELAQILSYLGELAQKRGEYAQAAVYLQESLALARELGKHELIAQTLSTLGWVTSSQGDYSGAEELLREGIELARSYALHAQLLQLLLSLGSLALSLTNNDLMHSCFAEGLALARAVNDPYWISVMLTGMGIVVQWKQPAGARAYWQEGLELARQLRDEERIAILLGNLGDLEDENGNYVQGEQHLRESLEHARRLGHSELLVFVTHNLAACLCEQSNYQQAEAFAQESLELARQTGFQDRLPTALEIVGETWRKQGKDKQAQAVLQDGLALARQFNRTDTVGDCLDQLGRLATRHGDYTQADSYLREALGLASTFDSPVLLGSVLYALGELSLATHQDATDAFTKLLEMASVYNNQKFRVLGQYGLARVAGARGERETAQGLAQASLVALEAMGGHALGDEVRTFLASLP